ncbi:MAG: gliding motility-associated C-terminal domain-containing protein, partial [Vicingaceae bacterium]
NTPVTYLTEIFIYYNGSIDTLSHNIEIYQIPNINIIGDSVSCEGDDITLTLDTIQQAARFLWSTSATTPSISVTTSNSYWCEVEIFGCIGVDTFMVTLENCETTLDLTMPNFFTPNDDLFIPLKMEGVLDAEIFIYDRWGNNLFKSKSLFEGWNGQAKEKKCTDGTYYWIIHYTDINKKESNLRGFITLIK